MTRASIWNDVLNGMAAHPNPRYSMESEYADLKRPKSGTLTVITSIEEEPPLPSLVAKLDIATMDEWHYKLLWLLASIRQNGGNSDRRVWGIAMLRLMIYGKTDNLLEALYDEQTTEANCPGHVTAKTALSHLAPDAGVWRDKFSRLRSGVFEDISGPVFTILGTAIM